MTRGLVNLLINKFRFPSHDAQNSLVCTDALTLSLITELVNDTVHKIGTYHRTYYRVEKHDFPYLYNMADLSLRLIGHYNSESFAHELFIL